MSGIKKKKKGNTQALTRKSARVRATYTVKRMLIFPQISINPAAGHRQFPF